MRWALRNVCWTDFGAGTAEEQISCKRTQKHS